MNHCASVAVLCAVGCLLAQAPDAIDPQVDSAGFHWFQLGETRQEVVRQLGPPRLSSVFGADFEGWQFQIGELEEGEFSHHAVFRNSDGKLISMTREYPLPVNVDLLFPASQTATFTGPADWHVRARSLGEGRFLLAMGVAAPGEKTTKIVLLDESALRAFYPWLMEQIKAQIPQLRK